MGLCLRHIGKTFFIPISPSILLDSGNKLSFSQGVIAGQILHETVPQSPVETVKVSILKAKL